MSTFELSYNLLSRTKPKLGKIAIIPWDSEIFRFNIGQYEIGDSSYIFSKKDHLLNNLHDWSTKNQVRLIGCKINSKRIELVPILQELDFYFVDSILKIQLNNFSEIKLKMPRFEIRQIEVKDYTAVKKIAASSFKHGKYFSDFRFPKDLAKLRYKRWIENGIENISEKNKIYVIEIQKDIKGFFYVVFKNNKTVYLSLAAIKPEEKYGILGYHLYLSVLNKLKKNGVEKVEGSLSSSNISTLNLMTHFGFTCNRNELIFHKFSEA